MATGDSHMKFREDQSSNSRDMLTDTHRRVDQNTLHPYRDGIMIHNNITALTNSNIRHYISFGNLRDMYTTSAISYGNSFNLQNIL